MYKAALLLDVGVVVVVMVVIVLAGFFFNIHGSVHHRMNQ
jgi:hypothetical protein